MKYFYLLFLILSLFSFTLEQNNERRFRQCLKECKIMNNGHNRKRCEENCRRFWWI